MCQTHTTKMQKLLSTHAYKFLWAFITRRNGIEHAYRGKNTHTHHIVSEYNLHKNVASSSISIPLLAIQPTPDIFIAYQNMHIFIGICITM